jgi:hypothetical protein
MSISAEIVVNAYTEQGSHNQPTENLCFRQFFFTKCDVLSYCMIKVKSFSILLTLLFGNNKLSKTKVYIDFLSLPFSLMGAVHLLSV